MQEDQMKVKLFSKKDPSGKKGKNQLDLENEINEWLTKNPSIKVIEIKQSAIGPSLESATWFVSFWYEEVT